MRIVAVLLSVIALAVADGCSAPTNRGTPVGQGLRRTSAAQANGNVTDNGDAQRAATELDVAARDATRDAPARLPLATVNGEPIDKERFLKSLVESHGLPLLQQMVLLEAAQQEAARLGLEVERGDVLREMDLTLHARQYNGHDVENLTPARREVLIADWIRQRGVSRTELDIAMERQANLRKIADRGITITDAMLQEEYQRVHGDRYRVRHIQFRALRDWPRIKERLDQGEPFGRVARETSLNIATRERDGMLPLFAANDSSVPAAFAEAAAQLEPGGISKPIEAEGSYHVLLLEEKIPPDDAPFDSVRAELEANLHERLVVEAMTRLGGELLSRCRIQIHDSLLRRLYEEGRRDGDVVGPPLVE